jgi:hypothetical protein
VGIWWSSVRYWPKAAANVPAPVMRVIKRNGPRAGVRNAAEMVMASTAFRTGLAFAKWDATPPEMTLCIRRVGVPSRAWRPHI